MRTIQNYLEIKSVWHHGNHKINFIAFGDASLLAIHFEDTTFSIAHKSFQSLTHRAQVLHVLLAIVWLTCVPTKLVKVKPGTLCRIQPFNDSKYALNHIFKVHKSLPHIN